MAQSNSANENERKMFIIKSDTTLKELNNIVGDWDQNNDHPSCASQTHASWKLFLFGIYKITNTTSDTLSWHHNSTTTRPQDNLTQLN